MKKVTTLLLVMSLLFTQLQAAYSHKQLENLSIGLTTGLELKEKTGLSFERTLAAIMLTESSAGKNIIGDQFIKGRSVPLYKSSLGPMQIQIRTAREVMKKNPMVMELLSEYYHKGDYYDKYTAISAKIEYYEKILSNPKWRDGTSKKAKATRKWANAVLTKYQKEFEEYREYVEQDTALINLLLTDVRTSVIISFGYLQMSYEYAKKTGKWKPFYKAISRYNGGWNNIVYYKRVMKNLKEINRLIKEGLITFNYVSPQDRFLGSLSDILKTNELINLKIDKNIFSEDKDTNSEITEELAPGMLGSSSAL